ncbi:MAG: primosomal protein N' [Tannerella sp.]|nr:primosomal protein N' [Tannerella sp.]
MKYADVIVPVPIAQTFTYSVPADLNDAVKPYCLVKAPFGKSRVVTGLVISVYDNEPVGGFEIKPLTELLDDKPAVFPVQVKLWKWIASYYMCAIGDVFTAALPSRVMSGKKSGKQKPPCSGLKTLQEVDNLSITLTDAQNKVLNDINNSFKTKNITLLHGITSSGKTEIYINIIIETLAQGRQALYLLPELAVTTQITERLKSVFGSQMLVYHSGCTDVERLLVWNYMLDNQTPYVVLGMRSAVFLPFSNLGLVVIDEEQEPSYKQQDPAPRYHARNVAMILAQLHGAKTLLGSAAPSLESYLWAVNGKYGLVTLGERFGGGDLPQIEIADVRDLKRKRRMKDTLFAPSLREKIDDAISRGEQVILFRNRRGFTPFVTCRACGATPKCAKCDVSMTWHKKKRRLVCHYCGYSADLQPVCSVCGSAELQMQDFGTEKIEEEVRTIFPDVKVARLDFDNVKTRNAISRLLTEFESGETQILIGTQMITKGLDFARVSVVGILNADEMLNNPNFRAYERTFQMIAMASGRAGRRERQGLVVVQTSQADNRLLNSVLIYDYRSMAEMELKERYDFGYPPYTRLIIMVLRCKDEKILDYIAEMYASKLLALFGKGVSMPLTPPAGRVKNLYIRHITLKIDVTLTLAESRRILSQVYSEMKQTKDFTKIILHYDVDPL